jgi:hypothetical protein
MRSGWIVFIHWNNSSAGHCRLAHQQQVCDDCWLHGSQTQQQNLTSWLDYQQSLENNQERLVVKHCANTSGPARDVMTRNDLDRMRAIMLRQTRGSYEENSREGSQDRKTATVRSKRKIQRPSDYCEREEFYEAVTASWNMEGRIYAVYYTMGAGGSFVLRPESEVLCHRDIWKAGSGTSGLEVFQGVR